MSWCVLGPGAASASLQGCGTGNATKRALKISGTFTWQSQKPDNVSDKGEHDQVCTVA